MKKSIFPIIAVILFIVAGLFAFSNTNQETNAANFSKFKAGNIMSDYVMSNKNSMSKADISNFIRSKITCNQPYNSTIQHYANQGYKYHVKNGYVVCIADEYEWFGNKTAADIIYKAAQNYSINPQVLLVLIQKEQSLLSDKWPNSKQYASATGYACPDTAACNSAYSGFEKQVRSAAALYREVLSGGWTNYPVGWNYIQYNPNAGCGGTNVYVENRATSALYRFTPYQPNPATLSVPMGATASCGAYGNKNFYGYFTDWFGSTQGNRWSKMQTPRIMNTKKKTCKINPDTLATPCKGSDVISVNQLVNYKQKTTLADGRVCLRTATDVNNKKNKCVLQERLTEFTPTYTNITPAANFSKINKQRTCKVSTRNLNVSTKQCFEPYQQSIDFAKQTTILGTTYLITKHDWNHGNRLGFISERMIDGPKSKSVSIENASSKQRTCKVKLPQKTITKQCFEAPLEVSFAEEITYDGVKYLKTVHDHNKGSNYVFIAERFNY